jgi:radical SAM superfamily enzyme YgiQ (UPF0313 family)
LLIKVLLIDVDSKIPNLALMKISAFHKQKKDWVHLNKGVQDPDKVYISCIFKKNGPQALGTAKFYPNSEIFIGGSGVNYKTLPRDIEYIMPDYDLYDIDYSMGFTSRGCFRKCEFCIVPEKEGVIRANQKISEFLHPDHKKVVLLDNNLLAAPNHKETLKYLADTELKVSFCQGNDIRLMTEEKANLLADTRYYDFDFRDRRLYFAWDHIDLEDQVEKGIQLLKNAGITGRRIMFYVLMGFDTDISQDKYRVEKLHEWGVESFAMPFENGGSPELRRLVRKVNRKRWWYAENPRT